MIKGVLRVESSGGKRKREEDDLDGEHLKRLLQRHFGHSSFRGMQLEAIEAVLSGRDCFCLMPTGAGKSICYELPALARPGIVLVVSPLIALMEDQVSALKSRQIPAEFLSSTQSTSTKNKIYADLDSGKPKLKLLYVTPELISTNGFMGYLKRIHMRGLISLIAIDEAHCISSWGHDFRPSYRKLSAIRDSLPDIPILALTATASFKVREDIVKSLSLQKPAILVSSFNRPNIFYEVRYKDLLKSSYDDLRSTLMAAPTECTIIYCHARATCDEIGFRLKGDGIRCRVYHAGINDKIRSEALKDWASGKFPVIVATVAFGMGIDRKDVRMVCHFNMPKSLESFYQESGRAGRDGEPARSIMYYGLDDRKSMEFFIRKSFEKQKPRSSGNVSLKKDIEAFQSVVSYCEETVCRRRKVLQHFGEEVSPVLCAHNCDLCKWPRRVAASLSELALVSSSIHSPWASNVRMQNPSKKAQERSDFFYENEREDEEEEEEEGISSDDEGEELAVAAASEGGAQFEKKVAALLKAEQGYCPQQKTKNEKTASKNAVCGELRNATRTRLGNALKATLERLGTADISLLDAAASTLEEQCFTKYGKTGKTFYNSQVASMVRWLRSCCEQDLKTKLNV